MAWRAVDSCAVRRAPEHRGTMSHGSAGPADRARAGRGSHRAVRCRACALRRRVSASSRVAEE